MKLILLFFLFLLPIFLIAQEVKISGEVLESSGFPFPAAIIINKTKKDSLQLGFDAKFEISASIGDVLEFTMSGSFGNCIQNVTHTVSKKETLTIMLLTHDEIKRKYCDTFHKKTTCFCWRVN